MPVDAFGWARTPIGGLVTRWFDAPGASYGILGSFVAVADAKTSRVRWSLRHPVASSGLIALGCVPAGFLGALTAGGGVAHSERYIFLFAAMAMPIFYSSTRRQRARLISDVG